MFQGKEQKGLTSFVPPLCDQPLVFGTVNLPFDILDKETAIETEVYVQNRLSCFCHLGRVRISRAGVERLQEATTSPVQSTCSRKKGQ